MPLRMETISSEMFNIYSWNEYRGKKQIIFLVILFEKEYILKLLIGSIHQFLIFSVFYSTKNPELF